MIIVIAQTVTATCDFWLTVHIFHSYSYLGQVQQSTSEIFSRTISRLDALLSPKLCSKNLSIIKLHMSAFKWHF